MWLDGHTHPLHQQRENIQHLHLSVTLTAVKQQLKQLSCTVIQKLGVHRDGGGGGGGGGGRGGGGEAKE